MTPELEQQILKKLLKKSPCKLVVACSGGSDSTALFYLLKKLAKKTKDLELAICHINYELREKESESEEKFLKEIAKEAQIPFFLKKPEKTEKVQKKIGVQAWARKERYQIFANLAADGWQIALAHTQDDLLENILMRISRGTSPIAAKGMSENHGSFWRPLLGTNKHELTQWLKEQKLSWKEDSSNAYLEYSRNKFRHKVIPALEEVYPTAKSHIIRFTEQSYELAKFALEHLRRDLENCIQSEEGRVKIPLNFFRNLDNSLIHLILADFIRQFTKGNYTPENKMLTIISLLIKEAPESSAQKQLTTDLFFKIEVGELIFITTADNHVA